MHKNTTFELTMVTMVIGLASMYSTWVLTGARAGAWGTTIAASLVAFGVVGDRVRAAHAVRAPRHR